MKQEFEKFVCELAGVKLEYITNNKNEKILHRQIGISDNYSKELITYENLHQAKDAINRKAYNEGTKGHYHIRQGLALFIVSYCESNSPSIANIALNCFSVI